MAKKGAKTPSSAKKAEVEGSGDESVAAPEMEAVELEAPVEEETAIEPPVSKKKKAAAAAVAKENGVSDEAPVANGDEAPEEDGEAPPKVTDDTKAEVKEKKTPKPVKKTVPIWASLSEEARKNLSKSKLPKPKVQDAVLAAITACADSKGAASAGAIRKFVLEDNPELPKMVLKKAVVKAIERGLIKQVKGKGFTGTFKLESVKNVAKASKAKSKVAKSSGPKLPPLESFFPVVFTWATNPKEASVGLIRKYIAKHYPELDVEGQSFKKALENGESKGQLERITGKGFSGTFALVDGADKNGAKYEDAIENAVISMNEPKQVSVSGLRDYLGEYHKEYNTDQKPTVLKNALDRSVAKGWLQQITGKGFTGTYRLMHPYFPAPKELWGEDFVEKKEKEEKATPKRKATKRVAADSDSEEEEEEEEDEEVMPAPRKRGAPSPRKTGAPVKKVAKKVVAKKSKAAPPAKKGRKSRK